MKALTYNQFGDFSPFTERRGTLRKLGLENLLLPHDNLYGYITASFV